MAHLLQTLLMRIDQRIQKNKQTDVGSNFVRISKKHMKISNSIIVMLLYHCNNKYIWELLYV